MMNNDKERVFSLLELNTSIRMAVERELSGHYWVCAEISELHQNATGHCYLELIEKDKAGRTVARQRAMIWANTYKLLRPYFEQETGYRLAAGIKILVLVGITCHELYGTGLTIYDINPSYTLGDAARRRAEILAQLTEDGVADMNKELPLPIVPQRIAIITSSTAAGYGDFIDQLHNNLYGYVFYPVLFAAAMQGEHTEASVIAALNRINDQSELFDCVVIIRGGGATSDLGSFDSYPLAANVAQFPLPVIVGIGHERDETVLDYVAAVRVKTPTAAAEWLINRVHEADMTMQILRQRAIEAVENRLLRETNRLQGVASAIPLTVTQRIHNEQLHLQGFGTAIERSHRDRVAREANRLSLLEHLLPERLAARMRQEQQRLATLAQTVKLVSPDAILARGYSLILKDNKVVRSVDNLPMGEDVALLLADGSAVVAVKETHKK